MKKAIKYISFLLVFTLLAVGSTYVLIQRSLGQPLIKLQKGESDVEIVPEAGIDLNGFYDQNHLVFSEVVDEEREIKYPQIDGLKDENVEAAVNARIAAEAEALKRHFMDSGANINYLNYHIYGNFSNVLSIGLFAADVEYNYTSRYVNINLNDGSQLRLEDLFGAQADLLGIVRSSFYEELTMSNLTDDYWETVQAPDENELYELVTGYMASEDKGFFFDPAHIYFCCGEGDVAHVQMIDHAEDITVYHKYLSEESLFERDDIGHTGIFTCAHIPEGYHHREFGFAADNFWYDFGLGGLHFNDALPQETVDGVTAFSEELMDGLRADIEAIRLEAEANPDTMYILMAEPYVQMRHRMNYSGDVWTVEAISKAVEYSTHCKVYKMPLVTFETKYRAELLNMYRNDSYYVLVEGMHLVIGDDVEATRDDTTCMLRWDTGEELDADAVFAEGFDDAAAVRAYAIDELVCGHGYSVDEAELMVQALWYELQGNGLNVYIPEWGDERHLWMSLDQFPVDALTIFE